MSLIYEIVLTYSETSMAGKDATCAPEVHGTRQVCFCALQKNVLGPDSRVAHVRAQQVDECATRLHKPFSARRFRSSLGDDAEENLISLCSACHRSTSQALPLSDLPGLARDLALKRLANLFNQCIPCKGLHQKEFSHPQ